MRTKYLGLVLAVMAICLAPPAAAMAAQVTFAPLSRSYPPPRLQKKQGWLSITNRDWQQYTVVIEKKGRASLYRGSGRYPGMETAVVPSGATVILALEKDTWEFRGNNDTKLKVKIREGRTSTLSLEPFGIAGSSGLRGIANDGDKVRNEVLFESYYTPPVIVTRPQPPIVVHRPPPPPVIITRPPVIIDNSYRHGKHRRPPSHRYGDDDWSITFGFGGRR